MKFLIPLLLIFISNCKSRDDQQLKSIFKKYFINGSMLISSENGDTTYLYNIDRIKKKFIPASTFKIPNTLIALDEGIISSGTMFKWDGIQRDYPVWNKDQTLKSAFDNSCVWCYQELAAKIGLTRYKYHLKKLNYGNQDPSPNVDSFWLDGNLGINSIEQIDFLKNLYNGTLPYQAKHINLLKKIMIQDKSPVYTFYAKTGFSQNVGWYVGFIEANEKVWFFATNIEIRNKKDLDYRKIITIEAFKLKSIL